MKKELRKLKDTKTIILIIGSFNLPTFTHYYQGKTNIFYDEQGWSRKQISQTTSATCAKKKPFKETEAVHHGA